MKPLYVVLLILSASPAFADSFKIIRDGQEYTCTPSGPSNPNPGGVIDCVDKAYKGPFTRDEAMRLCAGAIGVGPADCAIEAYRGPFTKDESIDLCKKSGTLANAECATKAYRGPYTKAEAIKLCKSEPQLMMRSLNLMQQSREVQEKVIQLKLENPALQQ